jgi:hypothetical protein
MPAFTLAYCSFGDIVAAAQFVPKTVLLLRSSCTPSRGWPETIALYRKSIDIQNKKNILLGNLPGPQNSRQVLLLAPKLVILKRSYTKNTVLES